ncbi:hypothetical protein AURANDRAFT_67559 [Aureococcus anophagefferens]|uniref:ABC1 atypical kinase-like domain-containing protein n=1 Tax=Aureococcus anophagefferens TaxID=44056 RepID=F0YLL0_AURAN|nr:hypothetical protein AURANDRAFT_67559 [Aureococcus anophagefferens]EGB03996.1 hypothetical protein AURANDRAFT_67559 [Aureococcus anophagefferens]|eukprot:XP_009041274.1 hypothetical protein AURANDRAFT_67559 [Aureococcus anophagefferens]
MERILVLGAYRLFSIKRRMTGLACIRQGHAQDLERVAYVEREGGRAVLQIEFRRGYEDRGGFLMTVPWETPTTSTLARSLWELWLRSGGALERRRPSLEGHLLERLAASASLDAGDAPALHVALYSRLRHYVKRAPKPRTVSALTSAAVSGILDLAMCADEDAGPASRAVSKLELYALGGVLRASTAIAAVALCVALDGHRPEADALQLLLGACAASPAVADLKLVDCGAAGAVLAQAPPFSERLEVLDLSGNGVGAAGAAALAGLARGCGLLRALRLRRCDVGGGAAGFAALVRALLAAAEARRSASLAAALRGATSPAGPALRVLDLGENPLRDAGAAIVATFVGAASCRLRVLSVARCGAPLSELLRALREAARRDARLPAPLRGVAASLVRLDVSGNLLHPLARLGANEDARRLASVAEELPKLRELACGDLRYATTLSPAARGEDVAAVLDGALRRARRGLERLRVFDCSKSALSELKCPGGAWPEALLLDDGSAKSHRPVWALLDALGNAHSPPTSVSLARHGGLAALAKGATEPAEQQARLVAAASSCFANLDALHLQGARLQRDLGPLVAALAGAAPKLRVLNVAECGGGDDLCGNQPLVWGVPTKLQNSLSRSNRSDAGLEALGLLLSRSAALEQLACDGQRLGPQKVTLAGLRALRDGVLGAAEGPLLQLASPLADAARAARDRKDDAREIVACVRAMREAMRAQICDRAAPNSVPYDVLCVSMARAPREGVARADVAALAASARAQCGREGHTHRRDAKLRRRSSGSAEAGALVASVKNLATGGVRSLRTAKTAATMGLAHRQFQKELAKLLADDAGAGRRGKRSVVFHSFRLMFGRATIPRSADVFFRKRARADHPPSKRRRITTGDGAVERACDAYMARAAATFRDHVLREGGFQVKIGQMVAMQKALLPLAVTETLAPCCDAARAAPFSSLEKAVAERLGVHRLDEIFARVDHRPIGAASVAQVRALEPDHGLESFVDFRIEGHNRERLAAILERSGRSARSAVARVRLPRVHWALTREGVMVQDFVARAAALGDRAAVEALGVPFTVAVSELSQIFAECVFVHGYTHNDLHGGNVLVTAPERGSGASPGVRAWLRRGFLAFVYGSLVVVAAAASAAVAAVAAACWAAPHPLLRTVALSVAGGAVLSRFDRHRAAAVAAAVASLGIGEHRSLVAFFDGTLYPPEKFDVVLIDHGFHTDVPDAFRLTFCKTWAAVGLRDALCGNQPVEHPVQQKLQTSLARSNRSRFG